MSLFPSRAVAFELFGFGVHWYGLLYLASFLLAFWMLPRLQRYRDLNLTRDEWSDLIAAAIIGVVVGGRLGYVFFYDPRYYATHLIEILQVWKGGMASHGGFIGVTVALLWSLRGKTNDVTLRIADVVVIPITIGLGLGRIGNFINQELYGTVTRLSWGMQFPGAEGLRHPIQLYDFGLMMIIAAILFWNLKYSSRVILSSSKDGKNCALFLLLYGIVRFLLEFIREQHGVFWWGLSEGQWLTIPIVVAGVWLWRRK